MKKRLSQSTIEKLGYYEYALIDPRSRKVFYVGKGEGNRIYAHVEASEALYEATRKSWRVGPRAFEMRYACAVYLGIIREVYEIKKWEPTEVINGHQRHGFVGKVAPPFVRDKYRHTSVKHLFKKGHQSSIVYAKGSE